MTYRKVCAILFFCGIMVNGAVVEVLLSRPRVKGLNCCLKPDCCTYLNEGDLQKRARDIKTEENVLESEIK